MKQKGISFILLVIILTVISAYFYNQRKYQYGLDIKGGVRLTYQMDTSKLTAEQKTKIPEVQKQLLSTLTRRVSQSLGVVEGNVLQKANDQFVVELPDYTNPEKAREVLSSTASIKFYDARTIATSKAPYRRYEITREEQSGGKPIVYFKSRYKPDKVIKPGDPEYLKIIESWDLILQGDDLKHATEQMLGPGKYVPEMEFSSQGSKKMEAWTRKILNTGEMLAVVLDGQVLSIASVKDGTILSDKCFIDGNFTTEYVKHLTTLLNDGALPVDLKEISSQTIDPTIGAHALDNMVLAGLVSFAIICLFLMGYYLFPGIVAVVALCLYVLFTLTALKWIGATFSLAAIAGFILSVGMAVDANILVFERVKEEMRSGRNLLTNIELGFKRALPAIIDSNACTILTSLVLVNLGTGPVKGFASTLIIGLLISLFTAITVTRSLLIFFVKSGLGANPKWYALGRQWFGDAALDTASPEAHRKPLQIVNKSARYFWISAATIVPGIIFVFMGGLKPNVEFQGGYEVVYGIPVNKPTSPAQLTEKLEQNHVEGTNVKILNTAEGQKLAYITVPTSSGLKVGAAVSNLDLQKKIAQSAGFTLEDQKSFTAVGPTVQQETVRNAILGVVVGCALIVIYLAARFGGTLGGFKFGFRFGMSAIGALLHDVIFVVSAAAIVGYFFGWEISALFITAMLTVIGFSVHDSIVIFDRIRENLHRPDHNEDFANLCNRSITQSFARSINTSLTVVITLFLLLVMGSTTPDLKFFSLTMLLGVLSGTYSSIYNAAPILYIWDKWIERKKGKDATLIEEARRYQERKRLEAIEAQTAGSVPGWTPPHGYSQTKRRNH